MCVSELVNYFTLRCVHVLKGLESYKLLWLTETYSKGVFLFILGGVLVCNTFGVSLYQMGTFSSYSVRNCFLNNTNFNFFDCWTWDIRGEKKRVKVGNLQSIKCQVLHKRPKCIARKCPVSAVQVSLSLIVNGSVNGRPFCYLEQNESFLSSS